MLEESRPVENFEFIGGQLCLDFVNTLSDRFTATPVEVLDTYADLLTWGQLAGILNAEQAALLQQKAEQQPALAARWLAEIKQAREVLCQILSNVANELAAPAEELRLFNQLLSETATHLCVVPSADGFTWRWTGTENHLELPLWSIVRDAAHLLTSPELRYVRMCVSDTCDWLFLDTSKNHSRRWCDMKVCGNRAKAHRYYGRQRALSL